MTATLYAIYIFSQPIKKIGLLIASFMGFPTINSKQKSGHHIL
jgi:hypothetical protein